jgi:guanylate kinase
MSGSGKEKLLIIIGPTAVGKSTVIERAIRDYPRLVDLITYTTRPMRAGESEGNPYHFVTEEKFKELVAKNHFVEWAYVHGWMYGTPRDQIVEAAKQGKAVIMDIDVQGAKAMMKEFPGAVSVFILPPSQDALRQRFIKRGITNQADLDKRLESAQTEMAQAQDFHHQVVNEDLDQAYLEIRKIIENLLKNQ